jgi:hypothetical protein
MVEGLFSDSEEPLHRARAVPLPEKSRGGILRLIATLLPVPLASAKKDARNERAFEWRLKHR